MQLSARAAYLRQSPRSTQPSTLRGTVNKYQPHGWVIIQTAMGECLVYSIAAWRQTKHRSLAYIDCHLALANFIQVTRVNSPNGLAALQISCDITFFVHTQKAVGFKRCTKQGMTTTVSNWSPRCWWKRPHFPFEGLLTTAITIIIAVTFFKKM